MEVGTYPGVYIQEIPSGVRTITGVSTSITAFIGRALRGPVNSPVTIHSLADYERNFGGLWKESNMSYAVYQYFINGGRTAVINRVVSVDAKVSTHDMVTVFSFPWSSVDTDENEGNKLKDFLRRKFEQGWLTEVGVTITRQASENRITITKDTNSVVIQLNAPPDSATSASVTINNQLQGDAFTADTSDGNVYLSMPGVPFLLKFESISEGTWGDYLSIEINHDVDNDKLKEDPTLFKLVATDTKTGTTESFHNLSTNPSSPRFITHVLKQESNLIRVPADNSKDWHDERPPQTRSTVNEANRGSDGEYLDHDRIRGEVADKTGIYALDNTDLFNMLCIPPYMDEDKETEEDIGTKYGTVYTEALRYCKDRRAMLLVDPPKGWDTKEKAKSGIDNLGLTRDENATIFFPRILAFDLEQNRLREFVPCGAVAGVIARTDSQRGIWKSAAGIEATLMGVPDLPVHLTDMENGELNPLGINCLRILPVAGRVVWGSRTMRGADRLADQWKYLAVRRVALYIEESLYRGTQWVVFEPNDAPLWAQIRLNIGAFMHNLFTQGAFQGSDPKEAYLVKCDNETTTQYDIDRGIVNIIIGFAPLKPAEFVILKIKQLAGMEMK